MCGGNGLGIEEYIVGDSETLRDVRSVTKSITSLLVGAAIGEGSLDSVEQTVGEIMLDTTGPLDANNTNLQLRHLLTMSAGLEWNEEQLDEYLNWRQAADPTEHYISRQPVHTPGSHFQYSSGASHLLGRLVETATTTPLPTYADDNLFEPLGITEARWEVLADGSANAASGLELRTTDLIRIGRLVLDGGRTNGDQLVPAEWIDSSTRPQIETTDGRKYGFHWWVEDQPVRFVVASGYGGQTLAVAPDHDLVIGTTANWNVPADVANRQSRDIVTFLRERLVPAALASDSANTAETSAGDTPDWCSNQAQSE